jgi:hypothetical protein
MPIETIKQSPTLRGAAIGGVIGAVTRPCVFVLFWGTAADSGSGLGAWEVAVSAALGGSIGAFFGAVAARTTEGSLGVAGWAVIAGAMSAVTAFGTCIFLCIETSVVVGGGHALPWMSAPDTPADSEPAILFTYVILMGLTGAIPVAIAGVVASPFRTGT